MNLRFDQPEWLWLALLALPLIAVGWRTLLGMDRVRRIASLFLRTGLILLIAVMLARPRTIQTHDDLTVIGVLDVSESVRRFGRLPLIEEADVRSNLEYLRRWFRLATQTRAPDDRFGLIVFDGMATVITTPVRGRYVDDNFDVATISGTNIAEAIRLALAMFPADTARRIVLISDGNETTGDALDAAAHAAGASFIRASVDSPLEQRGGMGVPIDIAPVAYFINQDVQVVRIEAPTTARPGQTVTVRIILDATAPIEGDLLLLNEGARVDLNGSAEGTSRRLSLPAGRSVQLVSLKLLDTPVNRFEAVFEPLNPEDDELPDNNRAEAFTATPGKGRILLATREPAESALGRALQGADLPVQIQRPSGVPDDALELQAYDLIILDNVAAGELDPHQHRLLADYVNDQGGGLIMIGGDQSLGAGGWNGSAVEDVLPLELDPPRELRRPSAALVLVLDRSNSMRDFVAGARASKQEVANEGAAMAVESLQADSYVGVVIFDFVPHEYVPLQHNVDPKAIADRIREIYSDGGTNLELPLRMAQRMLENVDVERKRVVFLTDGRSPDDNLEPIAAQMAEQQINITTIAVGDDADHVLLERVAEISGGEFYPVRNPATLPRVLIDSVQVLNKPLIKEGSFKPTVLPTGSTLTADMHSAPPLHGLVMTARKPDPRVIVELAHPDGEPLLAHWQAGLGRAAVFTSDVDGFWSDRWLEWPQFGSFWTQLARSIARPATSPSGELLARIDDGRLHITLDLADAEGDSAEFITVAGRVYTPENEAEPVRLKQTGPRRFEGSMRADSPGNYIVALNPRRGDRPMMPIVGGANLSVGAEFKRYESNLALLEDIVRRTGGRRLDIESPLESNLFDRTGMQPSISSQPAWRFALWAALTVLLLDVACRRIAWRTGGVKASVARAMAKAQHTERAAEAAAAVSTLRTVGRPPSAGATISDSRPVTTPVDSEMPPAPRPAPAPSGSEQRKAPDPDDVAAALDAFLGRKRESPKPAREESATTDQPEQPEKDAEQSTSSLLAAKRRARDQYQKRR